MELFFLAISLRRFITALAACMVEKIRAYVQCYCHSCFVAAKVKKKSVNFVPSENCS